MSAFICNDEHINAIADELVRQDLCNFPGKTADMLYAENVRSVSFRYKEPTDWRYGRYEEYPKQLSAVQLIKAIECYRYQSCEHPEWDSSEAELLTRLLIFRLINELPGYEDAVWGVPSISKRGSK